MTQTGEYDKDFFLFLFSQVSNSIIYFYMTVLRQCNNL